MTDRSEWQGRVGRKWAEEWRRTDRSFTGLTDRLLSRASARPVARALDVGCGAGEVSLALGRSHPGAEIVGIDVSQELVEVARRRASHLSNVSFEVGDAADWRREDFAPDLVVSRHGVMFFAEPAAAFGHLCRVAAPDARLVFSCFRDRAENPWAERVAGLLPQGTIQPSDPDGPGPFAFSDRERVESILSEGGWREIAFEKVDFAYVAGAGEDPVGDAVSYFLSIGPAARAVLDLDDEARGAFVGRLRRYLGGAREGEMVALPGAAWVVSARRR